MTALLTWYTLTVAVADVGEVDEELAGVVGQQPQPRDVLEGAVGRALVVRVQHRDRRLVVDVV